MPCAPLVERTVPAKVGPPVLLMRFTIPPGVPDPKTAALPPRTASTRSTVSSSRAIASENAKSSPMPPSSAISDSTDHTITSAVGLLSTRGSEGQLLV